MYIEKEIIKKSCLNDLSSVGVRFKELLDFGFNQLVQNEIKPRLKQWCEVYQTISHKISEDELSQYEANDPFIQTLVKNSDQMLAFLKVGKLSHDCLDFELMSITKTCNNKK